MAKIGTQSAQPLSTEPPVATVTCKRMDERYALALGQAVIQSWGELPQEIQQLLFEKAVVAGHHSEHDESLREQLAAFLHDKHPRTAA